MKHGPITLRELRDIIDSVVKTYPKHADLKLHTYYGSIVETAILPSCNGVVTRDGQKPTELIIDFGIKYYD